MIRLQHFFTKLHTIHQLLLDFQTIITTTMFEIIVLVDEARK
jgi:hypothetical protein